MPADPASPPKLVPEAAEPQTAAGQLKSVGGLAALVAGLLTLVVILAVAELAGVASNQFTQLATAAIGVVGSAVGAYFGVKIGSDGTAQAVQGQREEAARAQVFAAHLPPDVAPAALQNAFPHAFGPAVAATTPPRPTTPPEAGTIPLR